ncbi:MAG: sugar ABC transporter permease [Treponema sp.]|jgi:ABC-type sugar transport system permease subunit|nr:sugar ABC transporter permease [Treponema sp.]
MKTPVKARRKRTGGNLLGYVFMLPWIVGFLAFTAVPFLYTIFLSFHDVALTVEGWKTTFTGINNYNVVFFRNTDYVPALISFAGMEFAYAPVIVIISFILALLLNREIAFRAGFRSLFFLPVIVMSGPVMYQLMDAGGTKNAGNAIQDMILYNMIAQFSMPAARVLSFLFENYSMTLWFTGIPVVLFIGGLQKISVHVIEAARIDGATPWQILWKITLPALRSLFLVCSILTIVQLGVYSLNPVLPLIQNAIYNTVSGLGLASAMAWVYAVFALGMIALAFFLLKEKP